MPSQPTQTMTDFTAATTAVPPYIRQPAVREPGFTALSWLEENGGDSLLARGYNDKVRRASNHLGKNTLYNKLDNLVRTEDCAIRDREVYLELQSIDFREPRALESEFDDRADAYALPQAARGYGLESANYSVMVLD